MKLHIVILSLFSCILLIFIASAFCEGVESKRKIDYFLEVESLTPLIIEKK